MNDLKKVFSTSINVVNGIEISSCSYEQLMISDAEYQLMYVTSTRPYHISSAGLSFGSQASTPVVNLAGSYYLCFDQDLNIRSESSTNINWKNLNKSKTEIIKESLKYFLREEYSEELFSMFLLKFGF